MKITDKFRLDWMQKHWAEICSDRRGGQEEQFLVQRPQTEEEQAKYSWREFVDFGWHKTIRQAIDAAIRASQAGRKS